MPPPDRGQAWRPVPARPVPTRARTTPDRELRHRALAALAFGMLALIALIGLGTDLRKGIYALIFSAAVGLAACIIGITALAKARRTGAYRPRGAIGGIVLGALAALLSVPLLAFYLIFPRQLDDYFACASQAQTSAQYQACLNDLARSAHLRAFGLGTQAAAPVPGRITASRRNDVMSPGLAAPTVRLRAVSAARPGRPPARR